MRRSGRAARAAGLVRRVGPHPLRLAAELLHRAARVWRERRLRHGYQRIVVAAPPGAGLRTPRVPFPPADALPSELAASADRIRTEAEAILEHRVDFLGSGLVGLGDDIDWERDFKSGYSWPSDFYLDLEVTRLNDDSDAKVAWELSRGHQLLTLARATRLFGDERFGDELERQLGAWLAGNPPGRGINWANPMEVALRAVNWLWAIGILEGARRLEPGLRADIERSLQAHARHLAANLEGSPALRSNHYLADVLGLLALAWALPGDPDARGWLNRAHRAFEREVRLQVHPDGVGFEASLPYHGLVLEMLLLARLLAGWAGRPLSPRFDERVRRMLDVSRAVRHSSGRTPQFGDNDSGRVLPSGFARPPSQDAQLWLGAAVLGTGRPLPGAPHEDVAWILGTEAWGRLAEREPAADPPAAFPHGGIFVLRGENAHVVIRCGDVGQNGYGGHAHNDVLSYELSHGRPLIVDSGTYAYTFDVEARNRFRGTAAHNVVMVDGAEINPIDPDEVFTLDQVARPVIERFEADGRTGVLVASHDGFRRLPGGIVHRRTFELDRATGRLAVRDEIEGAGPHLVETHLHLAPGVEVQSPAPRVLELSLGSVRARLELEGDIEVELAEGWVSDRYGFREAAPVVVARRYGQLPTAFGHQVVPLPGNREAADPSVKETAA